MKLTGSSKKAIRKKSTTRISPKAQASRPFGMVYMLLFAAVGVTFIIYALAAGVNASAIASSGSIGGTAEIVANTAAVSGRAVRFGTTGCTTSSQIITPPAASSLPSLPLTTNGRFIVSKSNTSSRVKLVSAGWYGFEEADYAPAGLQCQPLSSIVAEFKALGLNSVRLLFATDSWNANPLVPDSALTVNPDLMGLHLQDLMDKVINELARQGIMVVLDDHVTTPEWCCSNTDGNALWWEGYSPSSPPAWSTMTAAQQNQLFQQGDTLWKQTWQAIITRYSPKGSDPQPAVVGADLRNEPRDDTTLGLKSIWGGQNTPAYENWQQAATEAGNDILAINPNILIMVEGINYSVEFGGSDDPADLPVNPANGYGGVAGYPIQLSLPHQLVYSPHNYSWDTGTSATKLGQWWGYILGSSSYQAPIWVGEFGTCDTSAATCLTTTTQGSWWQTITSYLSAGDIDWSYWAFNGTKVDGSAETYGLLNTTWNGEALPALTQSLRTIEATTQQP